MCSQFVFTGIMKMETNVVLGVPTMVMCGNYSTTIPSELEIVLFYCYRKLNDKRGRYTLVVSCAGSYYVLKIIMFFHVFLAEKCLNKYKVFLKWRKIDYIFNFESVGIWSQVKIVYTY